MIESYVFGFVMGITACFTGIFVWSYIKYKGER